MQESQTVKEKVTSLRNSKAQCEYDAFNKSKNRWRRLPQYPNSPGVKKDERFVNQNDKEKQENKPIYSRRTIMRKYITVGLILSCVAILFTTGCSGISEAQTNQSSPSVNIPKVETQSAAEMAIQKATEGNKYLFLVFYKQSDPKSEEMKQVAAQAQKEVSARANVAYIDVADESEQALIEKYGIDQAPIPITLVMAPNGAIVTGFPEKVSMEDLQHAFVSPKMAEIIKATQDQKLVYLYIANPSIKYYKENLTTIQEAAETDLSGSARVIEVDPEDKEEAALIEQCKVEVPVNETNLLIVNGGYIVGRLTGKIDKQTLLQTTISGCGGGSCCPGAK